MNSKQTPVWLVFYDEVVAACSPFYILLNSNDLGNIYI